MGTLMSTKKFIDCSYRIEHAMIPFQSAKLSNDFGIQKKFVHAIDIHRKGMESVFIISKYGNNQHYLLFNIMITQRA